MDKLVMVALHTQPTSAVAEIDALVDVVAWAEKVSHNFLTDTLFTFRRVTLNFSSLAISMLVEVTSRERKPPLAGGLNS